MLTRCGDGWRGETVWRVCQHTHTNNTHRDTHGYRHGERPKGVKEGSEFEGAESACGEEICS